MSQPPFTLFHRFPPELKLDILSFCSRNDLVCLSLTGPDMRDLVTPLISGKPDLCWVDQLGSPPDIPSKCPDPHDPTGPIATDAMNTKPKSASNAERILTIIQSAKFPTAKNTARAFRVLCLSDCEVGWATESTVRSVTNSLRVQRKTTEDVPMDERKSGKRQITIGVAPKGDPTELGGGENGASIWGAFDLRHPDGFGMFGIAKTAYGTMEMRLVRESVIISCLPRFSDALKYADAKY
ncbi:f-box domain protein [Fusarium beomiforme]|uniref:F-box domain protein n=1 Tax=Fusarium beomiforme TaxID=44412 RepID=A0A9P5E128_9HYPO|nr:f-box domain protein [Fusarium beomiforme]